MFLLNAAGDIVDADYGISIKHVARNFEIIFSIIRKKGIGDIFLSVISTITDNNFAIKMFAFAQVKASTS